MVSDHNDRLVLVQIRKQNSHVVAVITENISCPHIPSMLLHHFAHVGGWRWAVAEADRPKQPMVLIDAGATRFPLRNIISLGKVISGYGSKPMVPYLGR